jgi:2-polyprenyl-3-methyl-5-hydroxy-6-metoxy-1,4-benzoquinol methylase
VSEATEIGDQIAPRIIHFIYLSDGGEDFPFLYYIALKSAKICNPTYKVILHSNIQPSGPFWRCVEGSISLAKVDVPISIFGIEIQRIEHKVDILKLGILLDFGGVYLDLDTVCLRPFDKFLKNVAVMGQESDDGLCNAVIIAPRHATFLLKWQDGYRDFHNSQWNEFSVKLPMRIAQSCGDLIEVVPPETFFLPNYNPQSLQDLFVHTKPFPDAYIFHLWAHVSKEYTEQINIDAIYRVDTTYNVAARTVVGDDRTALRNSVNCKNAVDTVFLERVAEERRIFEEIYAKSEWGQGSGNGSHPAATRDYRAFLEQFVVMNEVTSIVDVGCGDWQSSRYISFNGARYAGFDVVKSVVDINRTKFGSNAVSFDIMPDDPRRLPDADLLIIKDVLQHLTNDQILFYRDHIVPKYPLCLITNSWKAINYPHNGDIAPGRFRSLDLNAPPYSFNGAYVAESWNEWERIRTMLLTNKPSAI